MTAPAAGHRTTAQRWHTMTLAEQMANVGSEVDRALRAHATQQIARLDHALPRALELFDLTAGDDRWRGPRRREVLRVREEFCRLLLAAAPGAPEAAALSRYFLAFAVLARRPTGS